MAAPASLFIMQVGLPDTESLRIDRLWQRKATGLRIAGTAHSENTHDFVRLDVKYPAEEIASELHGVNVSQYKKITCVSSCKLSR